MAVYDYRCYECAHEFQLKRSESEADALTQCPQCGCENIEEVIPPFFTTGATFGGLGKGFAHPPTPPHTLPHRHYGH